MPMLGSTEVDTGFGDDNGTGEGQQQNNDPFVNYSSDWAYHCIQTHRNVESVDQELCPLGSTFMENLNYDSTSMSAEDVYNFWTQYPEYE